MRLDQMNSTTTHLEGHVESNLSQRVEELQQKVEHFVQSLTKVLKLPIVIRDLEARLQALE